MPEDLAISRATGDELSTVNRRKVQIFFQRFPGSVASSGIQGLEFTLTVGGAPPITGTTPASGKIELRLGAGETATLDILGSQYVIDLLTGGLFPLAQLRGVQQRLNLLGYHAGTIETPVGNAAPVLARTSLNQNQSTELAIVNFQSDNNPLFIDGVAGPNTQSRLQQAAQNAGGV
ncbi:MAG: peptidoglycan-binding domain-containing protein [Opitutus sp.]